MNRKHLAFLILCASRAAWGQVPAPWPEPLSAPWPLADVAVQGDSLNGVTLLASPKPSTKQSDSAGTFVILHVAPGGLRAWTLRARRFLDSARAVPGDIQDKPIGISLQTDSGSGRLTLGFDHNSRPTANLILILTPPSPARGWLTRGAWRHADQLLSLFDSALGQPPRPAPPPGDAEQLAQQCALVPPAPQTWPRLDYPSYLGGQIIIQVVVDSTGMPLDSTVRVLLSSGKKFTAELQKHLGEMHFSPGTCDGRPIAMTVRLGTKWGPRHRDWFAN